MIRPVSQVDQAQRFDGDTAFPGGTRRARFAGSVVALAGATLLGLGAVGPERASSQAVVAAPGLAGSASAGLAPPSPARDPVALVARTLNALSPFAAGRLSPAAPYFLASGLADRQRAVACLAAAAWYEAGTGAADQRAVVQVILNRVRHPAFPNTVCGVVFQGSERTTGCQFTFTCDGSLGRRRPSPLAWTGAQLVAEDMLSGRVEPAVGLATHYHTDWVAPSWDRAMDKIAAVRTHLFFRWRGAQGRPDSFVSNHPGGEPRIALIEALSTAHRADAWPLVAAAGAAGGSAPDPALVAVHTLPAAGSAGLGGERLPDKASAPEQDDFLVTLSATADPDGFLRQAEESCAGRSRCRFIGWIDPSRRAAQLPMPGSSVDAISFQYVRQDGRAARAQWNCAEFARADRSQCLRRGG
ncbi:MAG: cell wall hydrolase [Novosphingobium sp.]